MERGQQMLDKSPVGVKLVKKRFVNNSPLYFEVVTKPLSMIKGGEEVSEKF